MSNDKFAVTAKRAIKPVKLTVTVEASKVNENGTFSGISVKEVKGPKGVKAVSHPRSGGAIFFQTDSAEGIEYLTSEEAGKVKAKTKLF